MSARSPVIDAPVSREGQSGTVNGQHLAEWLFDPLEAQTRPRGPYTLENADPYLDQEAVELYNGWLVWQEMTDIKERTVMGTIYSMLDISARKLGFGQAVPDQAECLLRNGDVIKPDGCLLSWERLKTATVPQGPNNRILLLISPELVIESRSPSNRRRQEARKRAQYFAHGTEIVWDVDEANEVIYVYQAATPATPIRYGKTDEITCTLLPGWRRRVADIFADRVSAEAVVGEVAEAWRTEGIEIGEARGIEIGEARGIRQGLLAALELGLELKFGSAGLQWLPVLRQEQNVTILRTLYTAIKTAQTLEQLQALYRRAL